MMHQYDKYQQFLRQSGKKETPQKRDHSSSQKQHPTILSGRRNPNTEAFKKLQQSSEIFKENTTPIKYIPKVTNYATERKSLEDSNTIRTLIPNLDKFASPERKNSQNIRYNPNNESQQKETKRILKTCDQRQQDFNHRINLPISKMQIQDSKEDNYGLGQFKTHQSTQKMKNYLDYQGHQSFNSQTDRLFKSQQKIQRNLMTSYQICKAKTDQKNGKKRFIQSALSQQNTQQNVNIKQKDINKIFKCSTQEIWEQLKNFKKGAVKQDFANQHKSQIDIR